MVVALLASGLSGRCDSCEPAAVRHFALEADLVAFLVDRLDAFSPTAPVLYARREWPVGGRVADLAICSFGSPVEPLPLLRGLRRRSFLEMRLLAETVQRPLHPASVARRLSLPVATVVDAIERLRRAGLVEGGASAVVVSPLLASSLPNQIHLVEAKLTAWREALLQAVYYRQFADLVTIALPERTAMNPELRSASKSYGVGVIGVDPAGHVARIVRPRRQPRSIATRRFCCALEIMRHVTSEGENVQRVRTAARCA